MQTTCPPHGSRRHSRCRRTLQASLPLTVAPPSNTSISLCSSRSRVALEKFWKGSFHESAWVDPATIIDLWSIRLSQSSIKRYGSVWLRWLSHWCNTMSFITTKIAMPWVCLRWCWANNYNNRLHWGSHERLIATKIARSAMMIVEA